MSNAWKKLLDAGMQFTSMSQEQADKIVKDLVKSGQARRKDSEKIVELLLSRGKEATEGALAGIQAELTKQLGRFAGRLDEIERRVEDIAEKLGLAKPAPTPAPAKKAPAKKAPVKKAAAKKAPAKKAPVKKA